MRACDIIKKKRDGGALSREEIRWFCKGIADGSLPDYQISAFCMAVYFQGMSDEETSELTFAIRDSGERLKLDAGGIRVDKHSTGGVGDKTSLVVAPAAASCGLKLAKITGRGLGHTGGTADKLASIRGFRTELSMEEFAETVKNVGVSIVGQSSDFAPADKKLYALRDVTATVESLPLIVSSIMGKKLAADDDCMVLDVKCGSGAFMKTEKDAFELAEKLVAVGRAAGKKICALVTDMDAPLGYAIGNALEVKESIELLNGKGPEDLKLLCRELIARMLFLAEKGNLDECRIMAEDSMTSGRGLKAFAEMVKAHGGDPEWVYCPEKFPKAKYSYELKASSEGYIESVNAEAYGMAALILGAGRSTEEDIIDYSAGILLGKKRGDFVKKGQTLATLFTDTRPEAFEQAAKMIEDATVFTGSVPEIKPLIIKVFE